MNTIKIIELVNTLQKNTQTVIKKSTLKEAYKQLILYAKELMGSSNFEYVYQEISCFRVELLCARDFLDLGNKDVMFYLNKSIGILDVHLQLISWKISGLTLIGEKKIVDLDMGIQWTGGISEFVELCYALVESKRINNGEIKIKFFITQLSTFMNLEIKDCFNIYREIRKRKLQRTAFLDTLKEDLIRRMDHADGKSQLNR